MFAIKGFDRIERDLVFLTVQIGMTGSRHDDVVFIVVLIIDHVILF